MMPVEKNGPSIGDTYFMKLAIRQAIRAKNRGEVPVGAIIVVEGVLFSSGSNEREKNKDPLGHAEMLAIEHATQVSQAWRLENATLYVTVEPCLLCSGAIYLSRIPRVVFGCSNPKGGALRFVEKNREVLRLNHTVDIISGVRELECASIMSNFFKRRRKHRRDGRVVEGP